MGDRGQKDSGGVNHHYKMCMEIMSKETSKSSYIQHQNDDYSNDLWKFEKGKWKLVSPFSFFKSLLFLFLFYFMKWKGEQKQISSGKRENKRVDLGVREKIQMKMVEEGGKENGITTGLPPGKSFMFIVRKQNCLHTFED
jgi:hypothetical protein